MELILQNSPDITKRPPMMGIFYQNHALAGKEFGSFFEFYNSEMTYLAEIEFKDNLVYLTITRKEDNTVFIYEKLDYEKGSLDLFFEKNKPEKPFVFSHLIEMEDKKIMVTPNWNQKPFFPIINGYQVII